MKVKRLSPRSKRKATMRTRPQMTPGKKCKRSLNTDLNVDNRVVVVVQYNELQAKGMSKTAAAKKVGNAHGIYFTTVMKMAKKFDDKGIAGLQSNRARGPRITMYWT